MATATKRSFKDKARDKLGNIGTKIRGSSLESPTEGNVGANPSGGVIVEASTSPPLRSPITLVNTDLSEVGGNESNGGKDIEKKKRHVTQPKGTIPYDVTTSDTLEGIAARFDTTPTNLIKLNKLHLRMVFPGQTIYIPDKDYVPSDPPTPDEPNKSSPTNNKLKSPPPLKSPGHAERVFTDSIPEPAAPKPLSEDDAKKLDQECYARFIKINVKHITDGQGVVNGVLLVTPNAVMFDPNVSDPLVIESGADAYGMIAPMETIISAAMYHDIAAMRIRSAKDQGEVRKKSEVYHAKDCPLYTSKESSNDKNTASEKGNNKEEETQEKSDGNKEQTDEPPREKSCSCGASDPAANIDLTNRKSDSHSDSNTLNDEKGNLEESAVNETKVDSEPTIGANEKKGESANENANTNEVIPQNNSVSATQVNSAEHFHFGNMEESIPVNVGGEGCDINQGNVPSQSGIEENGNTERSPGMDGGITTGVSPPKQLLKSIGSSVGTLGNSVASVASSIGSLASTTPLTNLVDFSSGLFSKQEGDAGKVKDISDVTPVTPVSNDGQPKNSIWYIEPKLDDASGQALEVTESDILLDSTTDSFSSSKGTVTWVTEANSKTLLERPPSIEVESVVTVDDKPELFRTLSELVPKPAPVSENPPLYLSLRVGKPINKRVSKTCPIESYGKKNKPEYWFSIPRDRVDHLYAFFVQWSPNIYGSEEEINPEARGFVVFDSDAEDLNLVDDYFEGDIKVSKDWEIVKVEEARRRLESFELGDLPLPELIGTTTLLDDDKISKLCKHLPPRTEGYPWVQIYSTDHHGFSLNTLYRHMQGYDTPVLIVVKDTGNNIFGAMTSCPLKVSEHFYGTGESFLYTFTPEFKVYTWTGDNTYFNKGNLQSLVIGAGDGSFGLWLDGDIYHGRTQHCDTYDNEPLTTQEDFIVKGIEVWGFE
ncbi:unnamed protein product [Owenia fusiformis]|uniref:Oxidation resistance protein 1 n=1 Tax=Owenia fusiformis TaxID=6347 RepID=A0A8S4N0B2_OWEFU|nr:unnamed protein product [Owenia fusiformis]